MTGDASWGPWGSLAALADRGGAREDASREAVIDRPEPVQFELGARLEFRAGQPEGSAPGHGVHDLEIDPLAALRSPTTDGERGLAYEPRIFILLREPVGETVQKVSYLHRARLIFDVKPAPLWRCFVEARVRTASTTSPL